MGRGMRELAHIMISTDGDLAMARDETERRQLVRAVVGVAAGRLAVFNLVDQHLHLLARSDWPARLADSVRRVLRSRLGGLELRPPNVKPIRSRDHLLNCVGYILRQTDRHEIGGSNPALWTGSAFLDIVGARILYGFDLAVLVQEVPRLKKRELYEQVGLEPVELVPASDADLLRAGPARIAELAASVFAASPTYAGRRDETVKARALAAHVADGLDIATAEIARFIGVAPRAVRYLEDRHRALQIVAVRALRLRLALEMRVATAVRQSPAAVAARTLVSRR